MAEVYKATDEVLGRTVAVKIMLPHYAADPTFAARFKQEAQAAANLQSPYIVNIYDWGFEGAETSGEGTYYIVMEYVRGTDLKTAITQRGFINQRKVAEIGAQVCAALNVAHGYDIIHRDIKPHNLMIQPDGNTKVMDFGIARTNSANLTQTGSVLGTAYYVSPEQAQGKPLTSVTDIYSLGICLYEAATGKVPFDGPDPVSIAVKQVKEEPVPPRKINPDIDPALEAIILCAMAKDPRERFSTAEQMRIALLDYLAGRPASTPVDPSARTQVMGSKGTQPKARPVGMAPMKGTSLMPALDSPEKAKYKRSFLSGRYISEEDNRRAAIIIGLLATLLILAIIIVVVINNIETGPPVEEQVFVPSLSGNTVEQAKTRLRQLGLELGEVTEESNEVVAAGKIIRQNPQAFTTVREGTAINVVVSSGPTRVPMPDLLNRTQAEAVTLITGLGLMKYVIETEPSSTIAAGRVCRQSVPTGETVNPAETTIFIYVSSGRPDVSVPTLFGKTPDEAKELLENLGFVVLFGEPRFHSTIAAGLVMEQSPTSGLAPYGSTVTLYVSKGPVPVSVPNVLGLNYSTAYLIIVGAGLVPTYSGALPGNDWIVIGMSPAESSVVLPGTTITLIFASP